MDDRLLVLELTAWIERHLTQDIGTNELVKYSGYSLNRLRQKFFAVTGDTPSGYLRKRRLTEAAKEILAGEPILEVCLKYGYSTQDNFTTAFRSYFGVTPKEIYHLDRKYKHFIAQLREVYNIMELTNLKQPPFCSTLMGSIKGAADYFDLDYTNAMLFGLSGHVFLINIHDELCPSGPYAWSKNGFNRLLAGMGIEIENEYWFEPNSTNEERQEMEERILTTLHNGGLCLLESLEYQLVNGYDEQNFHFTLPWNAAESEKRALSRGNWTECLRDGFVGFKLIHKGENNDEISTLLKEALNYGLDLYHNPRKYCCNDHYKIGPEAFEAWIAAVKAGLGNTHGHWWNATVWAENRRLGAEFFTEAAELLEAPAARELCGNLNTLYAESAQALDQAKDRELESSKQLALLKDCMDHERQIAQLLDQLSTVTG